MPRHPPCALSNLTTTIRCSRPLCNSQDTGGTDPTRRQRPPPDAVRRGIGPNGNDTPRPAGPEATPHARSLRTQQRARPGPDRPGFPAPPQRKYSPSRPDPEPTSQRSIAEHHHPGNDTPRGGALHGQPTASRHHVLLRKEVIQPHLPVRLPCYDFVPIASPTLDGSLPAGLGHRLRVLPTFVT